MIIKRGLNAGLALKVADAVGIAAEFRELDAVGRTAEVVASGAETRLADAALFVDAALAEDKLELVGACDTAVFFIADRPGVDEVAADVATTGNEVPTPLEDAVEGTTEAVVGTTGSAVGAV